MAKKQRRGRGRATTPTGREITVDLTDFAPQGDALGHVDGKVVYAGFGIPGETVRVDIREETPQSVSGDVAEVIAASPDRVTPRCPHFGECGGCQLQHVAYRAEHLPSLPPARSMLERCQRDLSHGLDRQSHSP